MSIDGPNKFMEMKKKIVQGNEAKCRFRRMKKVQEGRLLSKEIKCSLYVELASC